MDEKQKYIILLGDGMADFPIEALGSKTPLEYSRTPNMDALARKGITGMARTVPIGMAPGSDTANLSIFGYDPVISYTGRAPLEALNMGLELGPRDAAFRCNLVSILKGEMDDFSAGHIDTEFTRIVIDEFSRNNSRGFIEFHPGVSYRNILIWRDYPHETITDSTPPHDIHGKQINEYLPTGEGSDLLREIMKESVEIIRGSEKIQNAMKRFKGKPTSAWLWGGGTRPAMETLKKRFGITGYTISAVDLIHGIGRAAGLEPIHVTGATGYIDTNYEGKAEALLDALKKEDYVYLHVESPDESGHEGNLEHKIKAIEDFDNKIVGKVMGGLEEYPAYSLLVMPDHPTPISLRTHTSDPVPFIMVRTKGWEDTGLKTKQAPGYSEAEAASTGLRVPQGHRLIELMIKGTL